MKWTLRLEELVMFALGIFIFTLLPYAWWWFLVLILLPDIGMIGYLGGNKTGATIYNIFHHRGLAIGLLVWGFVGGNHLLALTGTILFAHIAMDRFFGFGLKKTTGFKHTHLGDLQ